MTLCLHNNHTFIRCVSNTDSSAITIDSQNASCKTFHKLTSIDQPPRMTESSSKIDKKAGRVLLPSYVQPETYDLRVVPDMKAYTFDGIVSITMTTGDSFSEEESKKITLHSKELMYRSAEYKTEDGGNTVKAEEVRHCK